MEISILWSSIVLKVWFRTNNNGAPKLQLRILQNSIRKNTHSMLKYFLLSIYFLRKWNLSLHCWT